MKFLLIIGLLFSSTAFAESDMYNDVIQELNAKRAETSQKAAAIREANKKKPRGPRPTAINQYNPDGKLTNQEVLKINQQYNVQKSQEEQRYQQQVQMNQQNKYLVCMNNRVAATGKPLATLAREDQAMGSSVCN